MEIERKFLVNQETLFNTFSFSKLRDFEHFNIEQAYISTGDNEVRVREAYDCINDHSEHYITIKSKGNLTRKEVEFGISKPTYYDLINNNMYMGNIIRKTRYKIPLEENLIAELDMYGKELFGLYTVEVEFKDEEQANNFKIPKWFGEEVTNDKKYKNKSLAMDGIK